MEDFNREEKSSSSSFEDLSNLKEEDLKEREDEVVDILGNGQLTKKVLHKGEEDSRPARTDICKINLEGRLQDSGDLVEKLENVSVQLGDYELVQGKSILVCPRKTRRKLNNSCLFCLAGIDMAIPLMDVGEKAEIVCGPRFAYGTIGLKDDDKIVIPPDSTILYTVELLSAKPEDDIDALSFPIRKKIG